MKVYTIIREEELSGPKDRKVVSVLSDVAKFREVVSRVVGDSPTLWLGEGEFQVAYVGEAEFYLEPHDLE